MQEVDDPSSNKRSKAAKFLSMLGDSASWSWCRLFVLRPIATTLLSLGLALCGVIAYFTLPVASLPQIDFPTISVQASLPGASPETMASTVATPLERALGAIAGVNEITSNSTQGNTRVTLQFDLSKSLDGAARDVQAAINACASLLPSGLPNLPSYRKVNPAEAPILLLALTSNVQTAAQMFDLASTVLSQRLSQVQGVGQVQIGGGALPGVRIEVNPDALSALGIGLEDIRTAINAASANRPKGFVERGNQGLQIELNDQLDTARDYASLIVHYTSDARAVRLSEVASVQDSVQDIRNYGVSDSKPAILLIINKEPGSNVIETVERIKALIPILRASMPGTVDLEIVSDRTPSLKASLYEIQKSLMISIALVVLVVGLFLKKARSSAIPCVAVPLSLLGALGAMYLMGYSLNNLTLMALTIATGFVVDDAIVVLENVTRHMEMGKSAAQAAIDGVSEIGFTVVSISLSLVAAFIPILLMGGVLGRLFKEFAVVLSVAILISMVISLTTTPMMCAVLLRPLQNKRAAVKKHVSSYWANFYSKSLRWALRHQVWMWSILLASVALNYTLYQSIAKGFFPQQDTGRIFGSIRADQSSSFLSMQNRLDDFIAVVKADPAVEHVTGFTGGGQRNAAQMFLSLKPKGERADSADQVVARLRQKLSKEAGARLYLVPAQDIRIGARQSSSQYEYTIKADDLESLRYWEPRIRHEFAKLKELEDVNSDYEDRGLQTTIVMDRDSLARYGLNSRIIDTTLSDAYSQKQVGIIYNPLNQYRVVLEIDPRFLQDAESLKHMTFANATGQLIPFSNIATTQLTNTALSVSHEGGVPSDSFSFNLAQGVSLSQASDAIKDTIKKLQIPVTVRGSFSGTANVFQNSLSTQPLLITAALVTLYLVLGILYESLLHPITILSTLPFAGLGALMALMLFSTELSIIAMIGIILLIGIVKKNAILMIDFALVRQRTGMSAPQAIFMAAKIRARPILMTTLAAMLGALPLAFASGDGSEMREPLGIAVLGGLIVSQMLTLYTVPVVFLAIERLRVLIGAR
jgi:multidrug efflux pump